MQVESQAIMNDRITRGLRSQYSAERSSMILERAYQEYAYRNPNANVPELYELFEGGYVDRSVEGLGYGNWCIGRPKSLQTPAKLNGKPSFHPTPISRTQPRTHQRPLEHLPIETSKSLGDILGDLIPDQLPESSGPGDVALAYVNVVIFGKPNSGKTNLAEAILEAVTARYGKDHVAGLRSTRDLPALFENLDSAFTHGILKAIVIFADDMTRALEKLTGSMSIQGGGYSSGDMITGGGLATFRGTITEKMNARAYWLDRFWDIRGELAKRGMRQGLVIVISATHRFYGLPIDLRADVDLLLARSTATPGTFDARVVENMLGLLTCAELRIHETKALHDRTELSWAGYRTKSSFGLVRVPRATEAQMVTVYSKPKSRRSKQPWWGPLLLLAGTLAALALLLNPWW